MLFSPKKEKKWIRTQTFREIRLFISFVRIATRSHFEELSISCWDKNGKHLQQCKRLGSIVFLYEGGPKVLLDFIQLQQLLFLPYHRNIEGFFKDVFVHTLQINLIKN